MAPVSERPPRHPGDGHLGQRARSAVRAGAKRRANRGDGVALLTHVCPQLEFA